MHYHRHFARHSHGSSFEANPLPELEAPRAQAAVDRTACQDDRRSFTEKSPQMSIAASGYMAVIIDFSRLVAASCQADASGNRTGLLEVARIFNGSGERGCGDGADAGDRHEYAACLALTCICDKLAPKLGGTDANAAPGFQHR